jgi:hypothetical protein
MSDDRCCTSIQASESPSLTQRSKHGSASPAPPSVPLTGSLASAGWAGHRRQAGPRWDPGLGSGRPGPRGPVPAVYSDSAASESAGRPSHLILPAQWVTPTHSLLPSSLNLNWGMPVISRLIFSARDRKFAEESEATRHVMVMLMRRRLSPYRAGL